MSMQILPNRDVVAVSRKARRVIGRCNFAVAAVSAGFFAIAVSAFGADLGSGSSTAIAGPSPPAPARRQLMQAHPIDFPDLDPALSAQHARMVDQLYEQLMRRAAPGCSSGSRYASMGGAC